jgi:heterodisulfide reductase subunit A2
MAWRLSWRSAEELQARGEIGVDLIVLAPAPMAPSGTDSLCRILGLRPGPEGFLLEGDPRLEPCSTTARGIFTAGCITGAKDIRTAVTEGAAAAAGVLCELVPGRELKLEPGHAVLDSERCSGCQTCLVVCPYGAMSFDPRRGVSTLEERLCQGCGSCAAHCPSRAVSLPGFTDEQLTVEIEELLR